MPRAPLVLVVLVVVLAGSAWLLLREGEPDSEGPAGFDRTPHGPASGEIAELRGRPRVEIPAGEWHGAGAHAGEVSGRVVDATDAPGSGVTIRLEPSKAAGAIALPPAPLLRTREDGTFRFVGLPPGVVRVVLEHTDTARVEREVVVPVTDLVLRLAPGRLLDGHVRAADGTGVAGAAVHLRIAVSGGVLRLQSLSDRDGHFEFYGLPYVGLVSLAVDAGSQGRARPIDLPWKLGRPFVLDLDPSDRHVDVRVSVVEERGGETVPRAKEAVRWRRAPVFWDDPEPAHDAATDDEGRVTLALPIGVQVTFEAPSLSPDFVPKSTPPWSLRVGETPVDVELRVTARRSQRRVRIRGRVVDEAGAPIPGATVGMATVSASDAIAWPSQPRGLQPTDHEGQFAFEADVVGGPSGVFARAPGRLVDVWKLPPPPADVHEITLTLKPGNVLTGRVVDEAGAPVPGVRIALRPRGWGGPVTVDTPLPVLTDAAGEYRVEGLAVRMHFVRVETPEGATVSPTYRGTGRNQELRDGETRAMDLVVARGGVLAGFVVDTEGTPIAGAHVQARGVPDGTPWSSAWTDVSGRFEIRGLARGPNAVRVTAAGFVGIPRDDLHLTPAQPYRAVLSRGREARGRVLDAQGEPLPFATVLFSVYTDEHWQGVPQAVTNGRGFFLMPAVDPADSHLLATAPGHAFRGVPWTGAEDVEIRALPRVVVGGTVVDDRENPVANVEVTARAWTDADHVALTANVLAPRTVRTDAQGRFRFADLYYGRFSLEVKRAGVIHGTKEPALAGQEDVIVRLPGTR